ncbi:MAG: hypothetical protein ACNA8J_06965 [Gammaproteobacteria bacterium]
MFNLNAAARCRSAITVFSFLLLTGSYAAPLQAGATELPGELDVVGGNSSNSRMFWLNYDAENDFINEAVQVNDDASSYPNLNSFTFFRNSCGPRRADVIAASTNANQLVLYRGGKGTGGSICPAGNCPDRPSGLSTSNEQVVAVATTGAGGSTPAVWLFRPDGCDASDEQQALFTRHGGGAFSIAGEDRLRFRSIVATDFVRADGGGLEAGDLLVLSSNPPMIARLTREQVENGETIDASVLLDLDGFIRRATPTGMALVPGTGDIANLLVTFSTGDVVNLAISAEGDGPEATPKATRMALAGAGGMFSNPQGIAAGQRNEETYFVVSEQSQGRYIRAQIAREGAKGNLAIVGDMRSIVSPVGAPQGVAINPTDDRQLISECYEPITRPDGTIGCNVAGALELHFSQGKDGPLGSVSANLKFIPDPLDNTARDELGRLKLPGYDGQDFFVPATCRGFEAENPQFGGVPQLVFLDIELSPDFSVTPGNFIQITELTEDLLGLDGNCIDLGTRIYYHPSKDSEGNPLPGGGTLFDTTVSCQNPSRSIVELFSPVVLCQDPFYVNRYGDGVNTQVFLHRDIVNEQVRIFLRDLKDTLEDFSVLGETDLAKDLKQLLVSFTNPDNRNITDADLRAYFKETADKADSGAIQVLAAKRADAFGEGQRADIYARLLRGFLGLAFYAKETGALEKYYPPAPFCEPVNTFGDLRYAELPGVKCECSATDENFAGYLCGRD